MIDHTSGPWKWIRRKPNDLPAIIQNRDGKNLISWHRYEQDGGREIVEGNATLMANAPLMYEVLHAMAAGASNAKESAIAVLAIIEGTEDAAIAKPRKRRNAPGIGKRYV